MRRLAHFQFLLRREQATGKCVREIDGCGVKKKVRSGAAVNGNANPGTSWSFKNKI